MSKKNLKRLAGITAFALILGLAIFANSLVGNPISKTLAKHSAQNYLKENYKNTDFYIDSVSYSFKDGNYIAHIKSPSSIDSSFSLSLSFTGKVTYDSYESYVAERFNTANRITMAYRELTDTVLKNPKFPYELHIAFGDLMFEGSFEENDPSNPPQVLLYKDLELDKNYDICELGSKYGNLVIYIRNLPVNETTMAETLLTIKQEFEAAGIPFYSINCVLEDSENDKRIEVAGFPSNEIYEEGLTDRILESNQKVVDWYESQDKMK